MYDTFFFSNFHSLSLWANGTNTINLSFPSTCRYPPPCEDELIPFQLSINILYWVFLLNYSFFHASQICSGCWLFMTLSLFISELHTNVPWLLSIFLYLPHYVQRVDLQGVYTIFFYTHFKDEHVSDKLC